MAEISLSATEAALENQRLGALQIRRASLCTLVQICDGYDIGSIGIAELREALGQLEAPVLDAGFNWAQRWHRPRHSGAPLKLIPTCFQWGCCR